MKIPALIFSLSLVACIRMPTNPTVYLDDDWTVQQYLDVESGMKLWEPYFDFQPLTISHYEAMHGGPPTAHAPYIILAHASLQACSQLTGGVITPNEFGMTRRTPEGIMTSCVDPTQTDDLPTAIAHELGHAMRLDHIPGPAIMSSPITSNTVTQADIDELHSKGY